MGMKSKNTPELKYLEDFYYSPDGNMVFTESYHLKRGTCCGSGCFHCPYDGISIENSDQGNVGNSATIQCPFCFESFSLPCNSESKDSEEIDVQQFIYDCEVCCHPIDIILHYQGAQLTKVEIEKSN